MAAPARRKAPPLTRALVEALVLLSMAMTAGMMVGAIEGLYQTADALPPTDLVGSLREILDLPGVARRYMTAGVTNGAIEGFLFAAAPAAMLGTLHAFGGAAVRGRLRLALRLGFAAGCLVPVVLIVLAPWSLESWMLRRGFITTLPTHPRGPSPLG